MPESVSSYNTAADTFTPPVAEVEETPAEEDADLYAIRNFSI